MVVANKLCAVSNNHFKSLLRNIFLFVSLLDQEARLDGYCRAVLAHRCSNSCLYIAGEEQASQKTLSSAFQSAFNYGFPYYFVR